jgi:tetratricopeptide (TPR) repeat protein
MDSKELVSRLKEMIMDDQVQQVVALLLQEHQRLDVPFSEADLLQISGRLSSIEREKNLGIITNEQYSIARNQLRQLLVDKVLSIEKPKPAIPPTPVTVPLENGDQLLAQGHDLYNNEAFAEAEAVFRRAVESVSTNERRGEAYAMLGHALSEQGYYPESIEAHQHSLEVDPNSSSYWTNLGIVYRMSAEYDKAAQCYEKALAINPDYAQVHASLGALHITHTLQFDKAIQHLEKAIKLNPGLAVSYSNMAIAQASVGNFAEADRYLRMAVMKGYTNTKSAKQIIDNLRALS